ncbi:hypothetical protein [Moraxella ovis]|uniref:hypothetical protein n=1 Tax=Moraxella ovis TaxID=29433 RepID=UPI000D85C5F0|nr:hypothetical protein [Moraxella ovis]SPX85017.1 Uncharacterised protein [Moraxella ovis]STZ05284.1 Uncharacterised protein [Moraxella ovis]
MSNSTINQISPIKEHIIEEIISYIVQCLVFFMIMVLSTDFFRNEKSLKVFLDNKLKDVQDTFSLFLIPIISIIFTSGLIFIILRFLNPENINYKRIDISLKEIPKLFYLIGSSFGVLTVTISINFINQDKMYWGLFYQGLFIIIGYFLIGCAIAYPLNRNIR